MEKVLRTVSWLVARLLLLSTCVLLMVTFNFTVFALHLVLYLITAVAIIGVFLPEPQPQTARAKTPAIPEPVPASIWIPVRNIFPVPSYEPIPIAVEADWPISPEAGRLVLY